MDKKTEITRRRFIQIIGAFGACAALPVSALAEKKAMLEWDGISLGADSNIKLFHPNQTKAKYIIKSALTEITRLEKMFSLYRKDSLITQLNESGSLKNPPIEFLELIQKAKYFGDVTNGQFDISVQPLWNNKTSVQLIDYQKIRVEVDCISFSKPNMQITLNGIAQGYITDKVSNILRNEGVENALVSLGEKYAIGSHPLGRNWNIGVTNSNDVVELNNQAIATSSNTESQHIYNPKTGLANRQAEVTVIAQDATKADALSTALCLGQIAGIEQSEKIRIIL